jgi:hypothetical protein
VLSVWLLQNAARWKKKEMVYKIAPLVIAVGQRDCHGPVYPVFAAPLASYFHLVIMEPLRVHRKVTGNAPIEETVLMACLQCMVHWWNDDLKTADMKVSEVIVPKITHHGTWVFADAGTTNFAENVAGAGWLYEQGFDRLVLCSQLLGGKYTYTIAKRSDFITGFPLDKIFNTLNLTEAETRGATLGLNQKWGGGSSIGGGPRDGSVLAPTVVENIVTDSIAKRG